MNKKDLENYIISFLKEKNLKVNEREKLLPDSWKTQLRRLQINYALI